MFSDAAARDDSFASAASFGQASAVSAKSFQSAKSGARVSHGTFFLSELKSCSASQETVTYGCRVPALLICADKALTAVLLSI